MPLKQTRRIVVRAKGERAEEIFELRIGETRVGDPVTTTLDYDEYVFEADPSLTGPVSVVFTNDYYDGYAIDRNLWVDHLRISRQQYREKVFEAVEVYNPAASAEASTTAREVVSPRPRRERLVKIESESSVVYSEGAWTSGDGCSPGFKRSERITCGGTFTFVEIDENGELQHAGDPYLPETVAPGEPPAKHVVKVRARGIVGGERFAVRIGPDILSNVVVTREWRTYRIPVNHLNGGKLVVGFMNDMDDNVHDFNLEVDWVSFDGERYESESPGTYVSASGSCESGYPESQIMYCNGAWFYTDVDAYSYYAHID